MTAVPIACSAAPKAEPERSGAGAADAPPPLPIGRFVAAPFRDPAFRHLLGFLAFFSFVNGLGSPFWVPYVLEDLKGSYSLLTVLGLAGGVAGLLTLALWGRALDRFGARPCLLIAALFASLNPLYYVVARPDFVAPIYADYISSGIVWGGFNLAVFDLLLTLAPERRGREMYFAAYAGTAGLAFATSSILAGALADIIPDGRRTVFVLVSGLRLLSLVPLSRIKEPGARPLGEVMLLVRRTLFGV